MRGAEMWNEMNVRVVKNDAQYRAYVDAIERLAASDPNPDTDEGAMLELLSKLVEDYEKGRYQFDNPDPVDVIHFRMKEQGLRQKDLAELLGGKNRASEVLSRKRPLTLPMIRALHERLGIPADLLIAPDASREEMVRDVDVDDVFYDTLVRRGRVSSEVSRHEALKRYVGPIGSPVYLKNTLTFGITPKSNLTLIWRWLALVRERAETEALTLGKFSRDNIDLDLLKYVTRLSWMEKGPRLAVDFLAERGIAVIVEPRLPRTRVDGAAVLTSHGFPIVALTLYHNRLDNFWFTLLHELVHVWKHLDGRKFRAVVDEEVEQAKDSEEKEREANEVANEALLPRPVWRRSEAFRNPTAANIKRLAAEQQIHPAIIAGRVRFERNNYALFSGLVGYGQVRPLFPGIRWE